MKCCHARRKISACMDHELDAVSVRQLESHLRQCTECRKMLDEFQEIDDMVRGLPDIAPDTDFAAQMVRIVNETALTGEVRCQRRLSLSERISRIIEDFADLLISARSPSTGTLDEFSDFPPFSIGQIYFRLMRLSW